MALVSEYLYSQKGPKGHLQILSNVSTAFKDTVD